MTITEPGIALLTDFGVGSPYIGQMQITLREQYLNRFTPIVELISDLPQFRPDLAAYLIPALVQNLADSWVYLCVVDPGVGSGRRALVLQADGQWFIGPDNGLLAVAAKRAKEKRWWSIPTPEDCSATFHGRDIFAPVAAQIITEDEPLAEPIEEGGIVGLDWSDELPKIIYRDNYGNLMTGLRAEHVPPGQVFNIGKYQITRARTFSDVPVGSLFWYQNSLGLVEFAANSARADSLLDLTIGDALP